PPGCGDPTQWDVGIAGSLCRADPLDPSIVDCDESGFISGDSTVRIGNCAGVIRVHVESDDPINHRRLYVAVRGDPSITMIDADLSETKNPGRILDCYDNAAQELPPPSLPGARPPFPRLCDVSALAQQ